jgi:hypothetical protein
MNAVDTGLSRSALSSSILNLLDRVEYRRVLSPEDFAAVGRLREISYKSREFIDPDSFGGLIDDDDYSPDCSVIGVFIDEALVSTIRLHIVDSDHRHGPSLKYFPQEAGEILGRGESYIDPSRFAADPMQLWTYPAIPFLTLRIVAMATEYFKSDYFLNCVRADNANFYRRSFGSAVFAAPRDIKTFKVPLILLGAQMDEARDRLASRFPFFHSLPYEQRMMFAPREELNYPPVNILPSARYANAHLFDQAELRSIAV